MTDGTDKRRSPWAILVPAAAAVVLVASHFVGGGAGPAPSAASGRPTAPEAAAAVPGLTTEERRAAWREAHQPSVLDTGEVRREKEFYQRMKVLGTTPVEIVSDGQADHGGLTVGTSAADLETFLAAGGHYSGPLPASGASDEEQR